MSFAQLALICAVALLGPVLMLQRQLRAPVVIGELAVGVLLGATGLQAVDAANPTFEFLAQVGFALVMFVAGTHVPVRSSAMRYGLRRGALRAVWCGVLAIPAGLLIARLFGTGNGWLYAVLIASSSAVVLLPTIGRVSPEAGPAVDLVPQIAIADAACIVLLPLTLDPGHAGRVIAGIAALAALTALAWGLLEWLERSGRRKRVHDLSEDFELAIELRSLLAILFGMAAIATVLDVSVLLAGFGLGLAVAAVGEPRRVAKQLFAITEGFFAPVFFVWLGASLNLRELGTHPDAIALGAALGGAAVLVHSVPALTGQPPAVAASTAAQLGVPIAAVTLGAGVSTWQPGEPAAVLLGALVTLLVTAALAPRVAAIAGAADPAPG